MIVPTIGRVIWVIGRKGGHGFSPQSEPALICYVHDEKTINVGGFGSDGMPFAVHHLKLVQEGEPTPEGKYAQWMPYQISQAKSNVQPSTQYSGNAGAPTVTLTSQPPVDNDHVAPGATPFSQ